MAIDAVHAIGHISVFLILLIPLYIIFGILRCYKGKFAKVFVLLVLSLIPMALFHFLESLAYFGIEVVPMEYGEWLEHAVAAIAVLAVGGFLYWFDSHYIRPLYAFGRKKK